MKKNILIGLSILLVLGIGAAVAGKGLIIKILESPPPDAQEPKKVTPEDVKGAKGEHGELIFQHPKGIDIIPPKKSSPEFAGYKAYRISKLREIASTNPDKVISAQVTLNEKLSPSGFEAFIKKYSVNVFAVEGIKGEQYKGMRYFVFTESKESLDLITNAVVEGTGGELLRLQNDANVLLVDPNIEGNHPRVLP
jgi:hypothetical protein